MLELYTYIIEVGYEIEETMEQLEEIVNDQAVFQEIIERQLKKGRFKVDEYIEAGFSNKDYKDWTYNVDDNYNGYLYVSVAAVTK